MQCEILEYKYDTIWNPESFLSDPQFQSIVKPNWPLVTASMSTVEYQGEEDSWARYLSGKARNKPSLFKNALSNFLTSMVGQKLGLQKQAFNVRAACAGSLYALYQATLMSLDSQTPVVVFCGDDFNLGYRLWQFNSIGAIDSDKGLPFDSTSQGFKMGTGISLMIVKHPSVKYPLDAKAIIQNFSFYTQPDLVTHPGDVENIVKQFSHIDYDKIDLWNAHATGTPIGDTFEYTFFKETCKHDIPIVGFKGYVGHCMSASGAVEICMALDCKKDNVLKPNIISGNKLVNDDRIITSPTSFTYKRMLKTSLAFGGQTVISEIDLL